MNCTKYNDPISYNAPIPYNGVCVTPPVPTSQFRGGGYAYVPPRKKKKELNEEDEVIALMLAEFMDDE